VSDPTRARGTRRPRREQREPAIPAPFAIALTLTLAVLCGGCATLGAKPWERDLLSERSMRLGAEAIDVVVDDHIYFSKEASSGGRGIGGGGCGCN
jgi:hypothetical protein